MAPRSEATSEERRMMELARFARLATVSPAGEPHVVPVCPLLDGDTVVVASEENVKVGYLRANPRAALVFDDSPEDWNRIVMVMVQGSVEVVTSEDPRWFVWREAFYAKFPQYEPLAALDETSLMLVLSIQRIRGYDPGAE